MKEHPIIFSAPMVNAILNGSKSMTRRVVKPQPEWTEPETVWKHGDGHSGTGWYAGNSDYPDEGSLFYRCPYGQPGDRLWVRETHRFDSNPKEETITYRADGNVHHVQDNAGRLEEKDFGKWRPSIFMPRWASRITLEITSVHVERLQAISGSDAESEGIELPFSEMFPHINREDKMIRRFKLLWDSINAKKHPWYSNPWVWVISFKKINP